MDKVTLIQVYKETWAELNAIKHMGDSFDDVIKRLLTLYKKEAPKTETRSPEYKLTCNSCGNTISIHYGVKNVICSYCNKIISNINWSKQ